MALPMSLLNSRYPAHINTWPDIMVFFIPEVITGLKIVRLINYYNHPH